MKFKLSIIFFYLFWLTELSGQQINGVCLVGPFVDTISTAIQEIGALNANWISISPEATLDRKTLSLSIQDDDRNWTNSIDGYKQNVREAKELGQKILLKPHVVLDKNKTAEDKIEEKATWRGDIKLKSYWDWKIVEEGYRTYIFAMAKFAQAEKIEILCIGTEMKSFVESRPKFWIKLISEIKEIYKGQIIYSANWDNFDKIPFWDQLDFIGVNSYFPISDEEIPEIDEVKKNWRKIKKELQKVCKKYSKQMIMTEFGYRNVAYAGQEPWTHNKQLNPENNLIGQYNLLNAYFQSLWEEEWVAGGFLWNWNYNPLLEGNTDFSVQNKPAIELVKQFYSKSL